MTQVPAPDPALSSIGAYGAAWLEPDPERRAVLVQRCWSPEAIYCDPLDVVTGRAALVAHIGRTQQLLPGGRTAISSRPVRHHDAGFFRWTMTDANGAVVMTGFDVVQFAENGQIARLTGFFDSDTDPPAQGEGPAA